MCVCVSVRSLLTAVCTHLDELIAEHKFRVWVNKLGRHITFHYFFFTSLNYNLQALDSVLIDLGIFH